MASTSTTSSLTASVTALRSSLNLLDSSITILDSGISDFPRMKRVLSSTRHFELLPQSTLQSAQQSLAAELTPAINTLLTRSEAHVQKLTRRCEALEAKSSLQEGRLSQARGGGGGGSGGGSGGGDGLRKKRSFEIKSGKAGGVGSGAVGNEEKMLRLKMLRGKKERLGYAVERLGLQSQQRQRQLRMSVAATKD